MPSQRPKFLLLVVIFVAIGLVTYVSFYGRPTLHSNKKWPANSRKYPTSKNELFSLTDTEDQWDAQWEDLSNSSPDGGVSSSPDASDENGDRDSDKPKSSKILQAVMLAGDLDTSLFERMLATHEIHSKRWGYGVRKLQRFIRGHGDWHESIFSKPLYILQLLTTEMGKAEDQRAEWIVWFDSDTIILNPNVSWELFLPPSDFPDVHMIGTRDWNGFNCGVFLVRVNEWSINLFSEVVALPLLRPDIELGYNSDQTAMREVLRKSNYEENFLYQPISWFNGFHSGGGHLPEVVPGDLLVHFAGVKATGKADLDNAIESWLNRTDTEPEAWALPLENTSYPTDIEAFWSRLRQACQLSEQADVALQKYNETAVAQVFESKIAVANLKNSYSNLEWVLREEPFLASQMGDAMRDVTTALESLKKFEDMKPQPNSTTTTIHAEQIINGTPSPQESEELYKTSAIPNPIEPKT